MTTNTTLSSPRSTDAATTTAPGSRSTRPPATAIVAASLACLTAAVGGYGAVYFTGTGGFTQIELTFLVAYEFLAALGLVSAIALLRGRSLGQAGTVVYALWMTVFTAFKVGYIHETEAIPFGIVGLVILGLALAPATRRFASR
jgi:hypothetical protein